MRARLFNLALCVLVATVNAVEISNGDGDAWSLFAVVGFSFMAGMWVSTILTEGGGGR